jgi:NAD+ kinase
MLLIFKSCVIYSCGFPQKITKLLATEENAFKCMLDDIFYQSMPEKIHRVAIATKLNNKEAYETAQLIVKILGSHDITSYSIMPLALDGSIPTSYADLKEASIDIMLAIGGDGTTLRACRGMPPNTPILPMNIGGNRGILSEVGADMIERSIHDTLSGDYLLERTLRIFAVANGQQTFPALNEILCTRSNVMRTPYFSINTLGDEINQRMDGVAVSTPTGSTGHCYSLGGPLLQGNLESLVIVPVGSINRMPSIVVPVENIVIKSNYDINLIVDGQEIYPISSNQNILISRYPIDVTFVRFKKRGLKQLVKLGF